MDDLIIVGAGWAGLTAAYYAMWHGAKKIRVIAQGIGSPIVSPGWVSVWDSVTGDIEQALQELAEKYPEHPYSLVGFDNVSRAINHFCKYTQRTLDLHYTGEFKLANGSVLTALGTVHKVAVAPESFFSYKEENAVLVTFEGWRDYFPALSGLRTISIRLPLDRPWDATPTDIAREFDKPEFRKAVIQQVLPFVQGASAVGFPAVLGLNSDQNEINEEMSEQLDAPVFEVPTLPPSVPGTRLFNRLRTAYLDAGIRMQIGHPVTRGLIENGRVVGVEVAAAGKPQRFYARNVILATGGLYGGGLFSDDRGRIWEPIFNLPVKHNSDRTKWFNDNLLDPRGHPIHYIGVRANNRMQPLDEHGDPVAEGLYVAGHILAHPEGGPPPFETSEGVALATAYRAVQCALGVED